MNFRKLFFLCSYITLLFCCSNKKQDKIIVIKNTLNIERTFETVELSKEFLELDSLSNIGIRDVNTHKLLVTQAIDNDGDGVFDVLLFQPEIPISSEKAFEIVIISEDQKPKKLNYCYSRFVPERTDDYAWENNKVAFRAYGPTAQNLFEKGKPNGTLSSGIDAWLKRVEYPIINKWYKKHTTGTGTYHEDTGEGLDNFHVGVSRGVGGVAVKNEKLYYFSKNYIEWKTITVGPIRTSFYLKYDDWDANGNNIQESKIISLDYGQNLSRFELEVKGTKTISAGLTLHEKDGEVTINKENAWLSYWQPHSDSEIGIAIVTEKKYFMNSDKYVTDKRDLSNAYANLNVINNKVIYYAGFGWKKSGQFKNNLEWEGYLNKSSLKINNPLLISIK